MQTCEIWAKVTLSIMSGVSECLVRKLICISYYVVHIYCHLLFLHSFYLTNGGGTMGTLGTMGTMHMCTHVTKIVLTVCDEAVFFVCFLDHNCGAMLCCDVGTFTFFSRSSELDRFGRPDNVVDISDHSLDL